MKMTARLASLLLPMAALIATPAAVLAEGADPAADAVFKPKEYDLARYATNFEKKSPFEYDPRVEAPAPEMNHFDGVSLAGYCGIGNTMSVYLIVGKEKKRVTVYGDGSPFKKRDQSGFRILSFQRGRNLTTTTVLLEKSGQQREVGFDKDTLTSKRAAPPVGNWPPAVPGAGVHGAGPAKGGAGAGVGPKAPVAPVAAYQPPPPFIPGQSNGQSNGQAQGNKAALQEQQAALEAMKWANTPGHNPNNNVQPGVTITGQTGTAQPTVKTRRGVILPTQGQ